jgi:hypothetical protein
MKYPSRKETAEWSQNATIEHPTQADYSHIVRRAEYVIARACDWQRAQDAHLCKCLIQADPTADKEKV